MTFLESVHCDFGKHESRCGRCRNIDGGRKWRRGIADAFEIDEIDFPCPQGRQWGFVGVGGPSPEFLAARKLLDERRAVCAACQDDCPLKHMSACQRSARMKRPGMVCPANPPKWIAV